MWSLTTYSSIVFSSLSTKLPMHESISISSRDSSPNEHNLHFPSITLLCNHAPTVRDLQLHNHKKAFCFCNLSGLQLFPVMFYEIIIQFVPDLLARNTLFLLVLVLQNIVAKLRQITTKLNITFRRFASQVHWNPCQVLQACIPQALDFRNCIYFASI